MVLGAGAGAGRMSGVRDTWTPRDLPVLEAVVSAFETNARGLRPDAPDLVTATGLPVDEVIKALDALDGEYLELREGVGDHTNPERFYVNEIYPAARRATGQWPSPESQAQALLQALQHLANDAPDPATRSKAKKMLTVVGEVGLKFLIELLSSLGAKTITG